MNIIYHENQISLSRTRYLELLDTEQEYLKLLSEKESLKKKCLHSIATAVKTVSDIEAKAASEIINQYKRQLNAYRAICLPMIIVAVTFIILYFTK